ncbi:MAG: AMP-binding protein, partial [Pseudomonadota bacterium]
MRDWPRDIFVRSRMTSAAADLSRIADPNAPRDRSALITFDGQAELENITYRELDGRIEDVAAKLRSVGCGAGSPVALLGETSAATMIVSLGIMRAGGVLVPINHKLPIVDQEKIIRHSECILLIHSELFADSISGNIRSSLSFEELVAAVSANDQSSPTDRAMIMYTSGSSGTPKGVPLTHEGYLWAMERFDFLGEVIRGRATLIAAPLFHMNGQFHALSVLMLGGTAVMLPTFSAATYIDSARNYEAARLTGVPTMFE